MTRKKHPAELYHFHFAIHSQLPNGATILGVIYDPSSVVYYVLARYQGPDPFVTWQADEHGNCFWGHYFPTYKEAVEDFQQRTRRVSR